MNGIMRTKSAMETQKSLISFYVHLLKAQVFFLMIFLILFYGNKTKFLIFVEFKNTCANN